MQDTFADPLALLFYLFIYCKGSCQSYLPGHVWEPARSCGVLGTVLARLFQPTYTLFFSRWVMTLLVDVDLLTFPCLLTATKISTFLFWSAKRSCQGRKVEIFLHNGWKGKSFESPFPPFFRVFLFYYFISLHSFTYSKGEETIDWNLWSQWDFSGDFSAFWINHLVNVCYCFSKGWEGPGKRD